MDKKQPKYIEGVGWRYETEHSMTRRHHSHRYNDVGTYLVTIVVKDRKPVFGHIEGDIKAKPSTVGYPSTVLSPLGVKLLNEELPKIHAIYPMVEIWRTCIMPDHLHLIVRINAIMPKGKYLGNVIGAFKGGVSRAWGEGTLFENNYNDRILMRDGQLGNWLAYLQANPFRWLVIHTHPELMQKSICLEIAGVRYGAFGNFLLLRHPEKVQVFFHRRMEDDRQGNQLTPDAQGYRSKIPTEQTLFWENEHQRLMEIAAQGDVLVTPGISECEKRIKNECLQQRHRLIHVQDKPIGQYWKPELSRFEACAAGTLLILAPWQEDLKGETNYERFHNLNEMAASVCALGAIDSYSLKNGGKRQADA